MRGKGPNEPLRENGYQKDPAHAGKRLSIPFIYSIQADQNPNFYLNFLPFLLIHGTIRESKKNISDLRSNMHFSCPATSYFCLSAIVGV